MRALSRKVYRDLFRMKTQVITIALVIGSGIGALITFLSTQDSLQKAQERFYQEARFAEVFSGLKRAPESLARDFPRIPGVVAAETRIVFDFLLNIPGRAESSVGRFISLPEIGEPRLNRLYLRRGRMPDPARIDEALISEGFAEANGFTPGDRIGAILNGKYKTFTIVGTALSPEYIYAIRGESVVPNDRLFGILWTSRKGLESAMDMEGSFNSVTLLTGPGASIEAILAALDEKLRPYGGLGAYARKDQVSHRFLSDEIRQQTVMAVAIPLIFLSVAAFLLNVVISRLIGLQRTQIATLKAVGYGNPQISLHYLKMVFVIVALGFFMGIGIGSWLGREFTVMYTEFYRFPFLLYQVSPRLILIGAGIASLAGALGVTASLRKVFHLQPAEAMRPPAPPAFHEGFLERVGLPKFLSTTGKIVLRNLTIRPWRTTMGILGVSFAVMITMLGMFWWDTVRHVIYSQFWVNQREDAELLFVDPVPERTLLEVRRLPGVLSAEGSRAVPVRLRFGHREASTALIGRREDSRLRPLTDQDRAVVSLPAEGLLLTQLLARKLGVEPGALLEAEVLEGKRQKWLLPVGGIVHQWVGLAAYLELGQLQGLLDEDTINQAVVQVDSRLENSLHAELKGLPKVAGVNFKRNVLESFRNTMVRFILVFATGLTAFALVIAIGVVYNNTRVALSERVWELMSLRVLGFTRKEVFRVLGWEMFWQIFLALPFGWLLGYLFAALMVKLMHTETFEIPLIIERPTFAYASLVVLISGAVSALLIRHRLDRTPLVEALKVRE